MGLRTTAKPAARLAIGVGLALGLAACGKGDSDFSDTFSNLLVYNTTKAPPYQEATRELAVECPDVQVTDGQSNFRAYSNAAKTNDSVRYQFSFGDVSRECHAQDGQIAIRVGVSGYLLSGPAGGAGTYSVPVRVNVRREDGSQIAASKVVRVSASLDANGQGTFSFVTDPLVVPYTRPEADQDYSIFIGFDPSGGAPEKPARRKKRG